MIKIKNKTHMSSTANGLKSTTSNPLSGSGPDPLAIQLESCLEKTGIQLRFLSKEK